MARRENDSGMAMITAIMASLVVLTLNVVAVQISLHDSDYSGRDRDRVSTVHAAEAGLDIVFSRLQSASEILPCVVSGKTTAQPPALYRTTIDYYPAFPPAGAPLPCGPTGPVVSPRAALVTSTSTLGRVKRSMQAEVRLTPVYGQFNKAIFSDLSPDLDNQLTIRSADGNADFYTNGNLVCPTNTGGGLRISGNLYAQGYLDTKEPCETGQTAWVVGQATLRSGPIGGDLIVGTTPAVPASRVTMAGGSVGGSIVAQACTGCPPAQFVGQTVGPPPAYSYPAVAYNGGVAWLAAGYSIHNATSCTDAEAFLAGLGPSSAGTKKLLFVSGALCPLLDLNTNGGGGGRNAPPKVDDKTRLYGDLAIVTTGSIQWRQSSVIESGDGQRHTLHVIIPSDITTCAAGSPKIDVQNQPSFDLLDIFFYVPKNCTLLFQNSNATLGGQLYAGKFDSSQRVEINYKSIFVPGVPNNVLTGYSSEIVFVREVRPPRP